MSGGVKRIKKNILNIFESGILDSLSDGVSIQDTSFRIIYQNKVAKDIFGEHYGEYCYRIYEENKEVYKGCPLKKVFRSGKPHRVIKTVKRDNRIHYIEITASPLRDRKGKIIAGIEIVRDITESERLRRELTESEKKFRDLAEESLVGVYLIQDGLFRYVNPKLAEIFGYSVDELIDKKGPLELTHPDDHDIVIDYLNKRLSGEIKSVHYTFRGLRKDKSIIHVEVYGSGTIYNGKPAVVGTLIDITDRIIKEENLKRLSLEFQTLLDTIPDNITLQSRDLRVLWANRGAAKGIGKEVNDLIDRHCYRLWHMRDEPCEVCPVQRAFITGNLERDVVTTPDGRIWDLIANPVKDKDGRVINVLEIGREITEEKKRENLLRQKIEQLSILRTIDSIIASTLDLKTLLYTVTGYVIKELGVDAVDVLILEPHSMYLEFIVGDGFKTKEIEKTRLRIDQGLAGRACMERKTLFIPDLTVSDIQLPPSLRQEGFKAYLAVPLIAKGEVEGVLEVFHRSTIMPDKDFIDFLETIGGQIAIAIDNISMFENLRRKNVELLIAYDTTVEGWANALDLKDKETEGHSRRVTELTLKIARRMGIQGEELINIKRGALLHDIGKIGVPDSILFKPGKLTEEEWEIMKSHPVTGYKLLAPIPFLKDAIDIPYCHHENWDGSGYPRGLKGREIPLSARIFAVVDVWDALRSQRPYRPPWSKEDALRYINDMAGVKFDPEIVKVFMEIIREEF